MANTKRKPELEPLPPRKSALVLIVTVGWAVLILAVLHSLKTYNVTLGQGDLFYRYSVVEGWRILRALWLIPVAAAAVFAVLWIGRRGAVRTAGSVAAVLVLVGLTAWIFFGAPQPIEQHIFRMTSPAQDGAFMLESTIARDMGLGAYLRDFDNRILNTPDRMSGTRVISNTPGMTMLCVAVHKWWPPKLDPRGPIERYLVDVMGSRPEDMAWSSLALRFTVVLTLMWVASGVVAYFLGRTLLPPTGALAFAIIASFNPSTAHFAPGKDTAQLLTINLMLWLWIVGAKRGSVILSLLAGIVLMIGAASGLIHFWIAAATFGATAWHFGLRRTLLRQAFPAAVGMLLVAAAAWLIWRWNLIATCIAVGTHFGDIQRGFTINQKIWFVIGLPLFLLFLSAGVVTFAALAARRWSFHRLGFAGKLTITTIAAMALTYVTGVTYELPRLWIAFLPPLTLGVMGGVPLAKARHRRAAAALAFIVAVQVLSTGWHWVHLDVRESEYRLSTERFFQ